MKKLYKIKSVEKEYSCYLMKGQYFYDKSLALVFYEDEDYSPYGTLTVCLEGAELTNDYSAFVDVNNWPDIENFIKENNLGEPTGRKIKSGYVVYPEYTFNKDIVDNIPFID